MTLYHSCPCLKCLQVKVRQACNHSFILMSLLLVDLAACVSGHCPPLNPMACFFMSFLKSGHCPLVNLMACVCRSFLKRNNVPLRYSLTLLLQKYWCVCVHSAAHIFLYIIIIIYHRPHVPSSPFIYHYQ